MNNPAIAVPGALPALGALAEAVAGAGVPHTTVLLVYLRASQVNGAAWNVVKHAADLRQAGESEERIAAVAAWREAPFFSEAERAALALAEAATRLADATGDGGAVPDEVWERAAAHYDEPRLAALLLAIGVNNLWHRLMVPTRQPAGPVPA
jgi:AhpD family alkylhydroperoxidase